MSFLLDEKIAFLKGVLGRYYIGSRKEELVFKCPFCEHRKLKLQINIEKDIWHCWTCNEKGSNLYRLIKKLGTAADLDKYNKLYKATKKEDIKEKNKDFIRIGLTETYYPLVVSGSFVGNKLKNYLVNERGLTEQDILKWKIGVASTEKYDNAIVFPSFDRYGQVNYFTARTVDPKRYHLPKSENGYKSSIIVNEMNIDFDKPIVIFEGFIDAIKSGFGNAVPLLGSLLSKNSKLFVTILEHKTVVYLALDADAISKKCDMAKDFIAHNIECYDVDVAPFHDVGEMTKEDFRVRFENAVRFDENYMLNLRMKNLA